MSETAEKFFACLAIAAGLVGCSSDTVSRADVVKTYSANLAQAYSDSVDDETAHQAVIATFLKNPTEDTLSDARTSWLAARAHYMLTEGARFYGGPIDGSTLNNAEALINSWPLDEAYIDYTTDSNGVVTQNPSALVYNTDKLPKITAVALDNLNASEGDEDISSGYHAVEFLLWGQALKPVGPGERPASDYDPNNTVILDADRRGTYLKVAVAGIISDLTGVRDAWAVGADYRVGFEGDPDTALTNMLTGLAKFSKGELGSQRIGAAYMSKERHDQHDCFSSETLVDYDRDARGIQNLYMGAYGDSDGPGINDLIAAVDPAEDTKLQAMIQASIDAIDAIPKPFEASIAGADDSPGRVAIKAALDALTAQGDEFGTAAKKLGLTIQVDDPTQ